MNAIFFTHHYCDDFVEENFKKLQQLNPEWDVYSIGFSGNKLLPLSLIANKNKYPSNLPEYGAEDWMPYEIEGEDFQGCNVRNNPSYDWTWIQDFEKFISKHSDISIYDPDYGDGGQTTCVSFNNSTLKNYSNEIITNKYLYENMFSELRMGTILKKYTTLKNIREDISNYVSWTTDDITYDFEKPYFYHPSRTSTGGHWNNS